MLNIDLEIDMKDIYMTLPPTACTVNSISTLFFPVCWDLPSGTKLMLIPGPVNYSIITPAVAFLIIDDCLL